MVRTFLPSILLPGLPPKAAASPVSKSSCEEIKYSDKIKFIDRIKVLKPEELGVLVSKISEVCPAAFKETESEKAQIYVDLID